MTPRSASIAIALAAILSAGCKTAFHPEDDAGDDSTPDVVDEEAAASVCGDGETGGAEECDDGANGDPDDGCTDGCFYSCSEDVECDDGLGCTRDACVAATHTCDHDLLGIGVECRPAGHPTCDPAEHCDGAAETCPGDSHATSGTDCDDGDACTTASTCDGDGLCLPVAPAPVALAAGYSHTCALTAGGGVKCWGSNLAGQLGMGDYDEITTAIQVSGLETGVLQISADYEHTCALAGGGSLLCWGDDSYGQLGDGAAGGEGYLPAGVTGMPGPATQVSAGGEHTCAVLGTSEVVCWGNNDYGQLGGGDILPSTGKVEVLDLTGVTQVSAGGYHTCALTAAGDVVCWGRNDSGQLGVDGTDTPRSSVPVAVGGLPSGSAIAVETGDWHSCALLSGGEVRCWGDNTYRQLGNADEDPSSLPVGVIGASTGVTRIVAGPLHMCAITDESRLICWGTNSCWNMADPDLDYADTAIPIEEFDGSVTSVAPGANMTCAAEDGWASCWGCNTYHELGDGTDYAGPAPVRVCGL